MFILFPFQMRSSAEGQLTTALLDKKEDLTKTCQKVRYLEEIVYRLKQEVDIMEVKLTAAETELKNPSQSTLHNILKPLLFVSYLHYFFPNSLLI